MRTAFTLALLLSTAACGSAEQSEPAGQYSTENATADVSAADAPAAPGIAPTAAPGVAFNYDYSFRLPATRISAVQEQHAAACEKLGVERCRITGMKYTLVHAQDIQGMLAFKLDPAIARAFGKQGIDSVSAAEGMLVDSEISGVDAGAEIDRASRAGADLGDNLRTIEAQLARPGLKAQERAELQIQAQQLREQIRSNQAVKSEKQESLARTPVVFHYGSGDLVPGLDGRPRFAQALDNAWENFIGGAMWILVALITLLPWAVVAGLGFWLWPRFEGWRRRRELSAAPPEA
ncbi:MAG TPA: hypothetical protein VGB62_02080 [Allosphingosinicella sp.]|jgi:hypothetical protein